MRRVHSRALGFNTSLINFSANPLRLVLRFGRVVKTLGALRMNARQRIDGMMADRAAFPLRIKDGGVAIIGKNR